MRTCKELILSSKPYAKEDRRRSWFETGITAVLLVLFLGGTFANIPLAAKLFFSFLTGLIYVRMFVIYHDYQHHAILQKSKLATFIMRGFGIYILAPENVWKRSHDHHHNNNAKLTINGIGSYPTISIATYQGLSKGEKQLYLINRNPFVIIMGYFTLFIYWLNVKSFVQSSKKHWDSLLALVFHIAAGAVIWYFFGMAAFFISWFTPFFIAFAMGSYLFYSQHNFPGAIFRENHDWKYEIAAMHSTSFMVMNPVLQWFTGNIGYHHVHHMNSRIPFYRLKEAMDNIPELQTVTKTSWSPVQIWKCFSLKLWDPENGKMITLRQLAKMKCSKVKATT